MLEKPIFKGVYQVGLVVKDLMASVKRYADAYGIKPWAIYHFTPQTIDDMVIRGRSDPHSMRLAVAFVGSVMIELIEPLDGKSIYAEFLEEHGEGIHHVLFDTDDYDKTVDFFNNRGIGILQAGSNHGLKYAYFDTTRDLGMISEIKGGADELTLPEPDDIYPRPDVQER